MQNIKEYIFNMRLNMQHVLENLQLPRSNTFIFVFSRVILSTCFQRVVKCILFRILYFTIYSPILLFLNARVPHLNYEYKNKIKTNIFSLLFFCC